MGFRNLVIGDFGSWHIWDPRLGIRISGIASGGGGGGKGRDVGIVFIQPDDIL